MDLKISPSSDKKLTIQTGILPNRNYDLTTPSGGWDTSVELQIPPSTELNFGDDQERLRLEGVIELELAESTFRANKLNEKNNDFNRKFLIIHAVLAIINLILLTLQLVKS